MVLVKSTNSVPWIPTPTSVIEQLFETLKLYPDDVFLDLGCGDGRIAIKAALLGAKSYCIEIDRVLCNVARIWSKLYGVEEKVMVIQADFYTYDLSMLRPRPTIVYLYLYPSVLAQLSPKIERELEPGTIVITLDFAIPKWSPIYVKTVVDEYEHIHAFWFYLLGLSNPLSRYRGISRELKDMIKYVKKPRIVKHFADA